MSQRLLADTCAALKLAGLGDKLFKKGALKNGDIILHPLLFQETRKWQPSKKARFEAELKVLGAVRGTAGLSLSGPQLEAEIDLIEITQAEVGVVIGRVDKNILGSVLCDGDMGLITNDAALGEVARSGFEVTVFTAEEILFEALEARVVVRKEVQECVSTWLKNGDSVDKGALPKFKELGIKVS